jgi:hypothetical protein
LYQSGVTLTDVKECHFKARIETCLICPIREIANSKKKDNHKTRLGPGPTPEKKDEKDKAVKKQYLKKVWCNDP